MAPPVERKSKAKGRRRNTNFAVPKRKAERGIKRPSTHFAESSRTKDVAEQSETRNDDEHTFS